MVRHARTEAGIGGEETLHPVAIAGEDHHEVVALVLHHLQQDLDGFLPVVALVLRPVEIIGLVDEQHAAHGALEHFLRLGSGMADILAHQIVAGDGDEMAFADIAEPVKDRGHAQRDGGLAGSRIAGEAHMQGRAHRLQAEAGAGAIDQQQRANLAQALLHRAEADEIRVELPQDVGEPAFGEFGAQVDRLGHRLGGGIRRPIDDSVHDRDSRSHEGKKGGPTPGAAFQSRSLAAGEETERPR